MAEDGAGVSEGDLVEYLESGAFDQLIVRGDVGVVVSTDRGWVRATWPRTTEELAVPLAHVRLVDG